jgi:2-C-methyl-D-erythritol 2,4-cyclodiphosphate synthase
MNATTRTILFWMFMILLAVLLWRMASTGSSNSRFEELSYNKFMDRLEEGKISEATLLLSQNSAEIEGEYREGATGRRFRLIVPKEATPHLMSQLRDKGVHVRTSEVTSTDLVSILINLTPILLFVGLWIFMIRQMKAQGNQAFRWAKLRAMPQLGIGYDLHRLEPGRKLILGGIEVPFDKGPMGHSDGDVLSHAICDALFGAAGLGDIGKHFPDTDPQWQGVSSMVFLEQLAKAFSEKKLHIAHIDAVVICERPKLGPHFPAMREKLAGALGIRADQINLKAKTNEGVDAIGRGEAIAAHAIATIER